MISQEPIIKVGIIDRTEEAKGSFRGKFTVANVIGLQGEFSVRSERGIAVFTNADGQQILSERSILCQPLDPGTFVLHDVNIGIGFHWARREDEMFEGKVRFVALEEGMTAVVNEIGLESYLKSVISSEMSAEAPLEFLRAHAIVSRSWLAALLERKTSPHPLETPPVTPKERGNEHIRWYGHEDHALFDVCADDHCQRYQGVSKIVTSSASEAVESTRGMMLEYDEGICDARYSKACGGITENFENVWNDEEVPYLRSVPDSSVKHRPIRSERDAERWIESRPEVYCNTTDENILRRVLPTMDRETKDFFRWQVEYAREELEQLIKLKSGIDFGTLIDLVPVSRGPSGRIVKLKIVGSAMTLTVGKELEIRRWLSPSHLYSSAFIITTEKDADGRPAKFILKGAGWGHGVGLCQIGAAVMASNGMKAEDIVRHYFKGSQLKKVY